MIKGFLKVVLGVIMAGVGVILAAWSFVYAFFFGGFWQGVIGFIIGLSLLIYGVKIQKS